MVTNGADTMTGIISDRRGPVPPPSFELSNLDAVRWLRDQPSESIDLLITDPAYESLEKHRAVGTTTRLKHSKASSNDWFQIFPNARFGELFAEAYRVLRRNTHFYLLCDAETMFVFCVCEVTNKAFAIECKFQESEGTVDEKIPYSLDDLEAMPMAGCIAYAGKGFSAGVLHMLRASTRAAYCLPAAGQGDTTADTKELDHLLAMHFGWWDVFVGKKKPVSETSATTASNGSASTGTLDLTDTFLDGPDFPR